jgi:hypothetical protein
MDVGSRSALGTPINAYLRSRLFVPGMEQAWVRHNIEEVGRLEHFLPAHHAHHNPLTITENQ